VSNVIGKTRGLGSTVTDFVRNNPVVSGAVVTLGGAAIVTGIVTKVRKKPKRKKAKRKTTTRRRKTKKTKKRGCSLRRRTPRTAGKGKDRSTKRIRYTSKGQPYVLMRSGKAKFIKKCSAKRSHKRKGGRY